MANQTVLVNTFQMTVGVPNGQSTFEYVENHGLKDSNGNDVVPDTIIATKYDEDVTDGVISVSARRSPIVSDTITVTCKLPAAATGDRVIHLDVTCIKWHSVLKA